MTSPTIVLYHNIAAAPSAFESNLGVTTGPDRFLEHLDHFQKNFDLIDLNTLLHGPLPRRPLLITFDDCYRSVLDTARTVLAPRGIPAVLFTNADLLRPAPFSLDNMLSWHADRHGLPALLERLGVPDRPPDSVAALLAGPMAARGAEDRRSLRAQLRDDDACKRASEAHADAILSADDLAELPTLGVEIGNHTASHVHCRALDAHERAHEIADARHRLEHLSGHPVRAFSLPYGNEADLTPEVLATLRDSGHAAIFLVHARSNRFRPANDIWYRVSLRNEPAARLGRMLHVLPALRTARNWLRR